MTIRDKLLNWVVESGWDPDFSREFLLFAQEYFLEIKYDDTDYSEEELLTVRDRFTLIFARLSMLDPENQLPSFKEGIAAIRRSN